MKVCIRRVQYNIDYAHILTFREEYKSVISRFFGHENVRYRIENENTINELVRLVFDDLYMGLSFRKDGLTMIYNGSSSDLKRSDVQMEYFWEIYERVKSLKGYTRTVMHTMKLHAVEIRSVEETQQVKKNSIKYLSINHDDLEDFLVNYIYKKSGIDFSIGIGNYSERDIDKQDLMPFKNKSNEDLNGNVGVMCVLEMKEKCSSPTFNKFKENIKIAEGAISEIDV